MQYTNETQQTSSAQYTPTAEDIAILGGLDKAQYMHEHQPGTHTTGGVGLLIDASYIINHGAYAERKEVHAEVGSGRNIRYVIHTDADTDIPHKWCYDIDEAKHLYLELAEKLKLGDKVYLDAEEIMFRDGGLCCEISRLTWGEVDEEILNDCGNPPETRMNWGC